jgi:hypothetical protein
MTNEAEQTSTNDAKNYEQLFIELYVINYEQNLVRDYVECKQNIIQHDKGNKV